MTLRPAPRPRAVPPRRFRAIGLACVLIAWGIGTARAQVSSRAEANQLHAAIVNGDVESVRYWLDVRHADASAANATEPGITPLARCLGLAAKVLDESPTGERTPREGAAPVVGLRVLQEIVTLLHDHGARLNDADRQRFSGPVLRWYDDAVTAPNPQYEPASGAQAPQPPPSPPATEPPAVSNPATPASTGSSYVKFGTATVVIATASRELCNGSGHAVYLVNQSVLSVTAKVTIHDEETDATHHAGKSDSYSVDPESSWRLGCDTSSDGRRVRYVLNGWR